MTVAENKLTIKKQVKRRATCNTKGYVKYFFKDDIALSFEVLTTLRKEISKDFPDILDNQIEVRYSGTKPTLLFYTEHLSDKDDPKFEYVTMF